MKRTITGTLAPTALAALAFIAASSTEAAVTFHTTKASFDAASTTAGIDDFEGIVADNAIITGSSFTDTGTGGTGTTYSGLPGATIAISGKDSSFLGSPFLSAILIASAASIDLEIDFTTAAGSGFTAAGGLFGDAGNPTGTPVPGSLQPATLTLYGNGDSVTPLDTQNVSVGSFSTTGVGSTFFGWTTTGGDTIDRIVFSLAADLWEAVDNIQLGTANTTTNNAVVPEPTSLALFGLTALGMGIGARRRRRTVVVDEKAVG